MTLTLKYAGFNYVADVDGSYADANSLATMIADTASNSVALTVDYAIDPQTSTVYADSSTDSTTGITETNANLIATIQQAEAAGLTVMVRPLIDFSYNATPTMLTSGGHTYADGDWRAYYNPADVATFFASYKTMIVAEAQAAQAGGAQLFDIGTELDQLTGPAYLVVLGPASSAPCARSSMARSPIRRSATTTSAPGNTAAPACRRAPATSPPRSVSGASWITSASTNTPPSPTRTMPAAIRTRHCSN